MYQAHKGSFAQESYEVGSEENREQYNIWLPESVLPGFRQFTTELFWRLNETATAILDLLIMSVRFNAHEAEYVKRLHSGHNNQLRLLHYPPIRRRMDLSRLAAHTDWRYGFRPITPCAMNFEAPHTDG